MTAKTTTHAFDAARYLDTPEALAEYVAAALETGDPAFIARSLGTVARAKGMTEVARESGLGRESLYKALSDQGNPELSTVIRVMRALGLKLSAEVS